ncbi:MAG: hypothetical protein A2X24_02410 [Chloroflexi bacterium GWB2_54_36]|nr:MAG: hypothetical protein A2X24_02410 [Chloroflexi bacterium GWB2_54_36]HBA90535.1 hypothetical protein [Anaerolineaceae bacterium]
MNPETGTTSRRPWWLKLLAFAMLVLSLSGWLRLQQSLARWDDLSQAGLQPGPLYLAITGALAGLAGLVVCIALWRRSRWAPGLTIVVLVSCIIWLWVDRLWIARSPAALTNWPFLLGASAVILTGTIYALHRGRNHFR